MLPNQNLAVIPFVLGIGMLVWGVWTANLHASKIVD